MQTQWPSPTPPGCDGFSLDLSNVASQRILLQLQATEASPSSPADLFRSVPTKMLRIALPPPPPPPSTLTSCATTFNQALVSGQWASPSRTSAHSHVVQGQGQICRTDVPSLVSYQGMAAEGAITIGSLTQTPDNTFNLADPIMAIQIEACQRKCHEMQITGGCTHYMVVSTGFCYVLKGCELTVDTPLFVSGTGAGSSADPYEYYILGR